MEYVVKQNETIMDIASKTGSNPQWIAAVNFLSEDNPIRAGDRLEIPLEATGAERAILGGLGESYTERAVAKDQSGLGGSPPGMDPNRRNDIDFRPRTGPLGPGGALVGGKNPERWEDPLSGESGRNRGAGGNINEMLKRISGLSAQAGPVKASARVNPGAMYGASMNAARGRGFDPSGIVDAELSYSSGPFSVRARPDIGGIISGNPRGRIDAEYRFQEGGPVPAPVQRPQRPDRRKLPMMGSGLPDTGMRDKSLIQSAPRQSTKRMPSQALQSQRGAAKRMRKIYGKGGGGGPFRPKGGIASMTKPPGMQPAAGRPQPGGGPGGIGGPGGPGGGKKPMAPGVGGQWMESFLNRRQFRGGGPVAPGGGGGVAQSAYKNAMQKIRGGGIRSGNKFQHGGGVGRYDAALANSPWPPNLLPPGSQDPTVSGSGTWTPSVNIPFGGGVSRPATHYWGQPGLEWPQGTTTGPGHEWIDENLGITMPPIPGLFPGILASPNTGLHPGNTGFLPGNARGPGPGVGSQQAGQAGAVQGGSQTPQYIPYPQLEDFGYANPYLSPNEANYPELFAARQNYPRGYDPSTGYPTGYTPPTQAPAQSSAQQVLTSNLGLFPGITQGIQAQPDAVAQGFQQPPAAATSAAPPVLGSTAGDVAAPPGYEHGSIGYNPFGDLRDLNGDGNINLTDYGMHIQSLNAPPVAPPEDAMSSAYQDHLESFNIPETGPYETDTQFGGGYLEDDSGMGVGGDDYSMGEVEQFFGGGRVGGPPDVMPASQQPQARGMQQQPQARGMQQQPQAGGLGGFAQRQQALAPINPFPQGNLGQGPQAPQAQGLAGLGRGGDSMLMHVNKDEVNQMATSINPETGLPEALDPITIAALIAGATTLASAGISAATAGGGGQAMPGAPPVQKAQYQQPKDPRDPESGEPGASGAAIAGQPGGVPGRTQVNPAQSGGQDPMVQPILAQGPQGIPSIFEQTGLPPTFRRDPSKKKRFMGSDIA